MYQNPYADFAVDSSAECKSRERDLFDRAINLLTIAKNAKPGSTDLVTAIAFVQKLWTALITDLKSPGNGLPDSLKGEIISIGLWVVRETTLIVRGDSTNIAGVIDINAMIRDGLK